MNTRKTNIVTRLMNRIFPPSVDFFGLLNRQIGIVLDMSHQLVEYMESQTAASGERIIALEAEADKMQVEIMTSLNEAFSTPVDREDIYRAVMGIEDIANYYKVTIGEIELFELKPAIYDFDMAVRLRDGVQSLKTGFSLLSSKPAEAVAYCDEARKFERKIEYVYRQALRELFTSDDFKYIFKRREVYRHLSNAGDRLLYCANNLQDIVVKAT